MGLLPKSMAVLIGELSKLPSIGERSATRLAYFLVMHGAKRAVPLAAAIHEANKSIKLCERCFFLSEETLCAICKSHRDPSVCCVVEKPVDVIAIERSGEFRGIYHVLHGLWAPLKGKGESDMKLKELVERVKNEGIKEVILATNATVEGDATALYVAKLLNPHNCKVSRLAQGLSKGGELEYADDFTLSRAFSGRNNLY